MRRTICSYCSALVLLAIVLAPARPVAGQPDPKREVAAVLNEAVRLLEAKQYVAFVKAFLRPAELEEAVAKYATVDAVAAEFAKGDRASVLLERLKLALKLEPTFRREGTMATFTIDQPAGKERNLSLQKIGDRWYLRD